MATSLKNLEEGFIIYIYFIGLFDLMSVCSVFAVTYVLNTLILNTCKFYLLALVVGAVAVTGLNS